MLRHLFTWTLLIVVGFSANANDLLDQLGIKATGTNQIPSTLSVPLSQDQMVQGLKEALGKGIQQAVSQLGQSNGFLNNLSVKIPMPQKLQTVEKTLRSLHQEKLADDFVVTMNRAAEQAVPAAASVFASAMQQMTIDDAKNILTGPSDAATKFFQKTTQTNLIAKFSPIVKKATESNHVTSAYKNLMAKAQQPNLGESSGALGGFLNKGTELLGKNAVDLDAYVTQKSLDGLFKMVAAEEKKIRENPAARTSEVLQQVFGAIKK